MRTDETVGGSKGTGPGDPSALALIGTAVGVLALSYASLVFTREAGRIALVWPANAMVVAILLRTASNRQWRVVAMGFLGILGANLLFGDPIAGAFELAACNGLEIALCTALLQRTSGGQIDLNRQSHLISFLLVAGLLAPLASAACAALTLALAQQAPFLPTLIGWYTPDALGLLIVTPALLALTYLDLAGAARRLRAGRGLASLSLLGLTLFAVFGQSRYPLFFLVPPALIFVAFELGLAGAAAGLLATSVAAVIMTLMGFGPAVLIHGGLAERLGVLQLFLATMTVAVLPVAAALAKRDRLEDDLRVSLGEMAAARCLIEENEARYRLLVDASPDVILKVDSHDIIQYVSPSAERHGLDPEAMIGRRGTDFIHPDDLPAVLARVALIAAGGVPDPSADRSYRILAGDGAPVWMEANSAVVRDSNGGVAAIVTHMRDVSERRAATTALAESEARYRLLTDSSTDIVLKVDRNDVIQYVSPSMRRYGYEPGDLLGKSGFSFVHPDDLAKLQALIADLFSGAEPDRALDRTYRIRTADGGYVWMEGNPAIIRDETGAPLAVISQLRDISDRRAAHAALAESEQRHRLIAESATDIISRMGVDGRVTYFSPSVTDITGYAVAEVTGASMVPLLHPDDVAPTLLAYRQLIAGKRLEQPLAYRIRHRDGHWIWLEGSPTLVLDAEGAPFEIIDVRRDVTSKVRLETELRAAAKAAEAAAAVKSTFMANMSHEIRTPLTSILGFTSLLSQQSRLDTTAQGYVDRVSGAGKALLSIVNDILDFSKLEAGQVEIFPKPTAAADLLRDALLMFTPQAHAKGLALEVEIAESLPSCLLIDPDRVRQILLNLIGNAVKFTDIGTVRVAATYDRGAGQLEVSVIDTGAGLTRSQQRKLFQRFSQVDASSTRQHGGTGLGLAISQGLADAMGGAVGVRSKRGEGSTFYLQVTAPEAEFAVADASQDDLPSFEGFRLLVADDNPANRELVKAILSPFGVEITEAVDGLGALEAATGEPFDAILMDVRMPGLDGPSAANRIRGGAGPNQDIAILAFSADVDLGRFEAADSAFDGIVRKPISAEQLIAGLSRVLHPQDALTSPTEYANAAAQ